MILIIANQDLKHELIYHCNTANIDSSLETVVRLINSGADRNAPNNDGVTAVMIAKTSNNDQILKLFSQICTSCNQVYLDETPVTKCNHMIFCEKCDLAKQYCYTSVCHDCALVKTDELSQNSSLIELLHNFDSNGNTFAHNAALQNQTTLLLALIKCGLRLNTPNLHGDTVAHLAAAGGHLLTLKVAVKHGGLDLLHLQNVKQIRPVDLAASNGHTHVLQFVENIPPGFCGSSDVEAQTFVCSSGVLLPAATADFISNEEECDNNSLKSTSKDSNDRVSLHSNYSGDFNSV